MIYGWKVTKYKVIFAQETPQLEVRWGSYEQNGEDAQVVPTSTTSATLHDSCHTQWENFRNFFIWLEKQGREDRVIIKITSIGDRMKKLWAKPWGRANYRRVARPVRPSGTSGRHDPCHVRHDSCHGRYNPCHCLASPNRVFSAHLWFLTWKALFWGGIRILAALNYKRTPWGVPNPNST